MKYFSYLIFILFILAVIMFLKQALEPKEEPLMITGSEKCGECHSLLVNGDQNRVWQASAHAKSYSSLLTEKAVKLSTENSLEVPSKNKFCLRCHTTGHFLEGVQWGSNYRVEEGVGCEACHGAGSRYSPSDIMKERNSFLKNNGIPGDENICLECHSTRGNAEKKISQDVCPFQNEDFNYQSGLKKIEHPLNRNNFK